VAAASRSDCERETDQHESDGEPRETPKLQVRSHGSTRRIDQCNNADESDRNPRHGEPKQGSPGARGAPAMRSA